MKEHQLYESLVQSLINLRTVPASDRLTWEKVNSGELVRLAPSRALPRELFLPLKEHQRQWILTYAHGCNAHHAVLAGRSAARMLGIWVIGNRHEKVELILPSGHLPTNKCRTPGTQYRRTALHPHEIRLVGEVRTTHPARSALDIARFHGFREGLVACDDVLRRGITKQELSDELAAMGKRTSTAVARRCIKFATDQSESPFESYARALLLEARITEFTLQHRIGHFRADFYLGEKLLVEIDGEEKDDMREKQLANQGFRVLRFHPQDLLADPDAFIDQVLFELTHAAA